MVCIVYNCIAGQLILMLFISRLDLLGMPALVCQLPPLSCFLERRFSLLLSPSLILNLKPHLMQMHIVMAAITTMVMEDMEEVMAMEKELRSQTLILKPSTITSDAPPKAMDTIRVDITRDLQNLVLRLM